MSCNGCRVLRKGCGDNCVLRACLQWIQTPEGQGNATLFLAKFFGRSDLLALIAAVPELQRPALFQSLLFEACGRTVNPVNGAVGLLSTGNWQVCQAAVNAVLAGGTLQQRPGTLAECEESAAPISANNNTLRTQFLCRQFSAPSNLCGNMNLPSKFSAKRRGKRSHFMENWPLKTASSTCSEMSEIVTIESSSGCDRAINRGGGGGGGAQETKLLNLFV